MPASPANTPKVVLDIGQGGLDRLPAGTRVLGDDGLYRSEGDGRRTPLERPEDAQRRREMLAGWDVAVRESDRRIAAEDAIAARRQGTFAPAARRMPACRPAARRPHASAKRSTARTGPPDGEDGEPEPARGRPEALAGPSPRFSRPWWAEMLAARFADLARAGQPVPTEAPAQGTLWEAAA